MVGTWDIMSCRIWAMLAISRKFFKNDIRGESYLCNFVPLKISDRPQIFHDFRYANYLRFDRSNSNFIVKTKCFIFNYMSENSNLGPAVNRQPVFPPERLVEQRYSEKDIRRNWNTNNLKISIKSEKCKTFNSS